MNEKRKMVYDWMTLPHAIQLQICRELNLPDDDQDWSKTFKAAQGQGFLQLLSEKILLEKAKLIPEEELAA